MKPAAFSAESRHQTWRELPAAPVDLLVIGGGITGAGIARDAAGRGLSVVLAEAGDFARGTSTTSSRLVHGGLRYLETRDFGLIYEASVERRRLLDLAPHLVRPLPFLFPVYPESDVGYRMLQAGMWLYDGLSLFRNIRRHRMLRREAALEAEPELRTEGLVGAAHYYDAGVDDGRLTLAAVRAAHEAGAVVLPHVEVVGFERTGAGQHDLSGAHLHDRLVGETRTLATRVVINAAGPWSDELRRMADPAAEPRLRPTKGVHLMVSRKRLANRNAIIFNSPVDGRVMFLLPWGDFAYIGTTDTDYSGSPAEVRADREDIDYLLASANHVFPGRGLGDEDVLSTWAGLRPLLAPRTQVSEGQTSREHDVWRDLSGMVNIGGGKLTTFRRMARDAADRASEILRREHGVRSNESATYGAPFPGAPSEPMEAFERRVVDDARTCGLEEGVALHLARTHGTDALAILRRVREDASAGERIVPPLPYLWGEVDHAVEGEMALRLEDVLRRRTHIFYERADGGLEVARQVAQRMSERAGISWSPAEIEREVAEYAAAVRASRGVAAHA
jgi:glycerol-3-phosphate dehydrogenase